MWTALLLGNVGTWMRDVGAGWLMTSLSTSATAIALVQVATTLPIFLLSLPAGALADTVNRRRLLIGVNVALALVALSMGVATQAGRMTAPLLLAALCLAGIGTALMGPVLQSLTPLMVERPLLRPAIALNSMGTNVARAIGPALGGALIATAGVAVTFFIDALSYLFIVAALLWWKGASTPAAVGRPERVGPAMRTGLRFVLNAPSLQRTLMRAASFFIFASAYWALLPLIARQRVGGGPAYYGVLLACIGAGAVASALLLPALRRRLGAEATMRLGTAVTIGVLVILASTRDAVVVALTMAIAGAGWIAVLTTANVSAQTRLPNWVRGRGLAVYLTCFYGAMSLGSLLWGQLADLGGIATALMCAAGTGVAAMALAFWKPLPEGEPDLTPSMHWPEPALSAAMAASLNEDRGPVLVTVSYRIDPTRAAAFLDSVTRLAGERLRDGAQSWGIYEDVDDPGRYTESFLLPSWAEHQRQHHRVTHDDAQLQAQVRTFHIDAEPPRVWHGIAPGPPA